MIRKGLIELIFEAASIERWNDHIRPSRGFTELDKQAHKMFYAYVLGLLDGNVDMLCLVEGGIFELLHRLQLTDIKPPVFHKLMDEKGDELNLWAINSISDVIEPVSGGFRDKMLKYFEDKEFLPREKRILEAAHYLATRWEFDIIYNMCRSYYGIENTKREIDGKLTGFEDLPCFKTFETDQNLQAFTNLVGGLRFQQRWSRSPRIPQTSVMGHMLIVALLSYFSSCEIGACRARMANNYLGGLFHDLPEVLTRDIVSPVKNSIAGLDALIKEIEDEQMAEVLYPLIPKEWRPQIEYFTADEFSSKITLCGEVKKTTSDNINLSYNSDEYSAIDGEIIRGCDHLAACIETYFSHAYGISTHTIEDGNRSLYALYKNSVIGGVDFGSLFEYFRI